MMRREDARNETRNDRTARERRYQRFLHCRLALWLLGLSALSPASAQMPPRPLDINESGRVLAQLDDVRAIFFVLVIVIVLMMVLVVWERRSTSNTFARSIDKLANAVDKMTQVGTDRTTAELVHNARVESIMSRLDAYLIRHEGGHDGGPRK